MAKIPKERKRHDINFWRKVKSLHREGKSREKICEAMGVEIKHTAFYANMRKNFDNTKANTRKFNHTHKRTDHPIYRAFELEILDLFNCSGSGVSARKQIALFLDYLKKYESYEKTVTLILRSDDGQQYEAKKPS